MSSAGRDPAVARPLPARRLIARTVMSWSQRIWQLRRTPVSPRAARTAFSACVIWSGSPLTNSTRQVVQRALPPQACSWSIFASSSSASTSRLPCGTSNVPTVSTVSFGTGALLRGRPPPRSLPRAEVRQSLLGLVDALGVGLAVDDVAVNLDGVVALADVALVQPRRPHPGVVLRLGVPLEAALEVVRRAVVLAVRLAF